LGALCPHDYIEAINLGHTDIYKQEIDTIVLQIFDRFPWISERCDVVPDAG